MWDIVYAIYRWVPLKSPNNPNSYGTIHEQIRKTRLFLDTYGVSEKERILFTETLIRCLISLTDFMKSEAKNGNRDFQANIEDGHLKLYIDDIAYIAEKKAEIMNGIISI